MNKLKQYREDFDFKIEYLSDKFGVSERYLYYIESNKRNPSLYLAKKISDFFGVRIEDIFFDS